MNTMRMADIMRKVETVGWLIMGDWLKRMTDN